MLENNESTQTWKGRSWHIKNTNKHRHLRDGLDHVDAELDAAVGVVGSRVRNAADAVVAIAKKLDSQAEMFRSKFVESAKMFGN